MCQRLGYVDWELVESLPSAWPDEKNEKEKKRKKKRPRRRSEPLRHERWCVGFPTIFCLRVVSHLVEKIKIIDWRQAVRTNIRKIMAFIFVTKSEPEPCRRNPASIGLNKCLVLGTFLQIRANKKHYMTLHDITRHYKTLQDTASHYIKCKILRYCCL